VNQQSRNNSLTALLICNGERPQPSAARRLARQSSLVVAADGGANNAAAIGLKPDVIIGDLDSVLPATLRAFRNAHVIRIRRQDNTDMEKALDYLSTEGVRRVFLLGATGKRLDMTLANLTVLWRYTQAMEIIVVGTGWYAIPVTGRCRLSTKSGTTVSLLPFTPCTGVTLHGLQYPLTNASWKAGDIAVSNVVIKDNFSVSIKKGRALLIVLEAIPILKSDIRHQNSEYAARTVYRRRRR
jgi:thiamine pyrophosphokinase